MNALVFMPFLVAMAVGSPMTTDKPEDKMAAMSMEEMVKQCNATYKIDANYLVELNKTGKFPDETDQTPMCFIHCIFDKSGLISVKGDFDEESVQRMFRNYENGTEVPDAKEMIDSCLFERTENDICEKSYGLSKCLMTEQIKKNGAGGGDSKSSQDQQTTSGKN